MGNVQVVITDDQGNQHALRAELEHVDFQENRRRNTGSFWQLVEDMKEELKEFLYI